MPSRAFLCQCLCTAQSCDARTRLPCHASLCHGSTRLGSTATPRQAFCQPASAARFNQLARRSDQAAFVGVASCFSQPRISRRQRGGCTNSECKRESRASFVLFASHDAHGTSPAPYFSSRVATRSPEALHCYIDSLYLHLPPDLAFYVHAELQRFPAELLK